MAIEVYVVPAITDDKILPTSAIPSRFLSNQISLSGSPGEHVPATFVIKAVDEDILSLTPEPSDLTGAGLIPASNIDIRVVKCWYQAGYSITDTTHKHLTPELLLKDDLLVKAEDGENYLKKHDGSYMWISDPTPATDPTRPRTIEEIPVQDSDVLQPVGIPAGVNKQFWVTVKVPDASLPGSYAGQIRLSDSSGPIGELQLNLEVLPIGLLQSYLTYSIYYEARLHEGWPDGSISSTLKSEEQLTSELENLLNHGITNPTVEQNWLPDLGRYLAIRNRVGMGNQPLYNLGLGPAGYQPIDEVQQIIAFAESYGITEVYFYGKDEAYGQALIDQRESWQAIRDAGGKMFVAGTKVGYFSDYPASEGNFGLVGDIQDLLVCYGPPDAEEAARWHSIGHKIFCYSNPQVGEEKPETYRRNFGLLLWQADYDGAMDFAYQWGRGSIWNDFDDARWRDHVFAYPTVDGVIDTIQWEGWREGVTDVRYLTTLLNAIAQAKQKGKDTTAADNYLVALKASNLQDLDAARLQMTNHILSLQGEPTIPEGPLPGNAALLFTPPDSYVDCGNNPILNPSGAYTIETWIRPAVAGEPTGINTGPLCKARSDLNWSWQLRYNNLNGDPNGFMGFQLNADPEGSVWLSVKRNLIPGQKYYLVCRFDGQGRADCLLGDSQRLEITDTNQLSAIRASDAPLLIGQDGWNNIFHGEVDETRISNIYRSDEELLRNWNGGKGRKLSNDQYTLALYHMDEGEGDILHDESPGSNAGVIYNATWVRGLLETGEVNWLLPIALVGVLTGIVLVGRRRR